MRQYAKVFLEHLPGRTIQLLVDLCTGQLAKRSQQTPHGASGFSLANMYGMKAFGVTRSPTEAQAATSGADADLLQSVSLQHSSSPYMSPHTAVYAPSPRQFFGAFAGNNDMLVKFLEGVVARRWPGGEDDDEDERRLIYGTLLELYLTPCELKDEKQAEEENARRLALAADMLRNPAVSSLKVLTNHAC
jgi:hypothetical protein